MILYRLSQNHNKKRLTWFRLVSILVPNPFLRFFFCIPNADMPRNAEKITTAMVEVALSEYDRNISTAYPPSWFGQITGRLQDHIFFRISLRWIEAPFPFPFSGPFPGLQSVHRPPQQTESVKSGVSPLLLSPWDSRNHPSIRDGCTLRWQGPGSPGTD